MPRCLDVAWNRSLIPARRSSSSSRKESAQDSGAACTRKCIQRPVGFSNLPTRASRARNCKTRERLRNLLWLPQKSIVFLEKRRRAAGPGQRELLSVGAHRQYFLPPSVRLKVMNEGTADVPCIPHQTRARTGSDFGWAIFLISAVAYQCGIQPTSTIRAFRALKS